jgi:hypothetical protein
MIMKNSNEKMKSNKLTAGFMVLVIATVASLMSCSGMGTRPSENDRNPIVVRAYLYVGKPVSDVRLLNFAKNVHDSMMWETRWDNFYRRSDSVYTKRTWVTDSTIDNAVVTISCNGTSYGLIFNESGWYREPSGALVIAEGNTYRIDVIVGDRHAWAETTVPSRASGLRVSRSIIYMDSVQEKDTTNDTCGKDGCKNKGKDGLGKAESNFTPPTLPDSLTHLVIKWNNPQSVFFYYRSVMDTIADYRPTQEGYVSADSLRISGLLFKSLEGWTSGMPGETGIVMWKTGRYQLFIYSTTPDYRAMLNNVSVEQNDSTKMSQDRWTKSPTNVHGGLGFFTAFSADSTSFTVMMKDGGS